MPQIKVIYTEVQTTGELTDVAYGDPIPLDGAITFSAQCNADVDTPSAKTFDSGAANVSDTSTVADVGVCEVSNVTCVADAGVKEVNTVTCIADIAGSLNSTYFLFSAM